MLDSAYLAAVPSTCKCKQGANMFKHILIPTDGSPLSRKAVIRGVGLAQALKAKVTGVFAAPPATPVIYQNNLPVGFTTPEEHAQIIERTAEKYLDFIERAAKKANIRCECLHITSDYPADVILATAKKKKCDLIVMATHGRRGIEGILLGSVTRKVLAQSKVPVLVQR
jgi:nucleotide-binding universal stress UspA family protein